MSKSILVIEDTKDNRQILNDMLSAAGYRMTEAEDGETGVALAAEIMPDLILMDVQLPSIDGYEATRRIRANPETRAIPIIAVTSYEMSGDEKKAAEAGCNGYVSKPFSPRHVLATIRGLLAKS